MIELFYDLLSLTFWLGTFALIVWWLWGMKKASTPRKRTTREEAELASLRGAIDRDQDELLRKLPPRSDPTRPAG